VPVRDSRRTQRSNKLYDRGVKGLTAYVLAGGKSTRMGADKAFLRFGDETLIEHAVRLARTVAENVGIVGDSRKFAAFSAAVVEDVYRSRGPLGGIHAALSASESELNLVLAVDMPLMKSDFLSYLVAQARESRAIVTVPHAGGSFQPLCAVYGKNFAELAKESLEAGNNKIDPLFRKVSTRIIAEEELLRAGFSAELFRNLNTPEDLESARNRLVDGDFRF